MHTFETDIGVWNLSMPVPDALVIAEKILPLCQLVDNHCKNMQKLICSMKMNVPKSYRLGVSAVCQNKKSVLTGKKFPLWSSALNYTDNTISTASVSTALKTDMT